MKNKTEICVPIRNEEELIQAKEMLKKNGEKVYVRRFFISKFKDLNYLILFKDTNTWIVSAKHDLTEIPLS